MNALLTLKTEVAAAKPAGDNAKAAPASDSRGFSEALEKQMQGNNKAESSRDNRAGKITQQQEVREQKAAKTDEAAVTASEDGKNLPPADEDKQVASPDDSERSVADADDSEQASDTENGEVVVEADLVTGGEDEATDTAKDSRATVAVAAPAIQNAATDKVTMTLSDNAKAQPKSSTTDIEAEAKALPKNLTPVVNAAGEVETTKAKTGFADILKQDVLARNNIRADILQAISQKTSSDDGDGQTLKTSLQNLLLGGDNKPAASVTAAELIRQIQPGQQRGSDNRTPAPLITGLTPATGTPGQLSSASAPQLAMDVQPQLNSPAWSRVVSSRVVWMAREGVQQAELRLNPANLGSVDVRLNINNDQASVTFLAQNAATREALEQAMPRLRESLAENGLSLTHSEVGHQDNSEQPASDDETNMQNAHSAQVSVSLDDTEDELPTGIPQQNTDSGTGVSIYA